MVGLGHLYLWRAVLVGIGLALAASCEPALRQGSAVENQTVPSVKVVPLSGRLRNECLQITIFSFRCPSEVPATDRPYRMRELDFGTDSYRVVEFTANAPYPTIGRRNAPPRFAHVVLKGGELMKAFPFEWPSGNIVPLAQVLDAERDTPALLGNFAWGGHEGTLVMAPAFPAGGVDGDHVVYRWQEGDTEYALSLHAWTPLEACVATLRTLVESINRT
jgi:hypothetical protein